MISSQFFPRNIVELVSSPDKIKKGISNMLDEMVKKSNYNKTNISTISFEGFHEFILENFFIGKYLFF